jgi:hypothetical protein
MEKCDVELVPLWAVGGGISWLDMRRDQLPASTTPVEEIELTKQIDIAIAEQSAHISLDRYYDTLKHQDFPAQPLVHH